MNKIDQDTNNFDLPFLTDDLPGIGGILKKHPEDFVVEEIPAYEFSGNGTHVLTQIEKTGTPTPEAIRHIASALGVPRRQIGYAGLKDARAVTRQWISIEHVDPVLLQQLSLPKVKIIQTTRHTNKLKIGHLIGNRFIIRIRQYELPQDQALTRCEKITNYLVRHGTPNYFGRQRFGHRHDSHLLGAAIIEQSPDKFVDMFLGMPSPDEPPAANEARRLYDQKQYPQALDTWPRQYHDQRQALKSLIKNNHKERAFNVIDKPLKKLYISAFQSHLFNQVIVARLPALDQLLIGDMAYKHENGACFRVEDASAEQSRCDAFEISPTGPLYGYRMTELTGPAGDIENSVLAASNLQRENYRRKGNYRIKGARRSLRFCPRHLEVSTGNDKQGDYLQLCFELDPGCYATTFIREITKNDNLF
ncbi:MAG: tRNA pseudouridine(13) synthase TruD [Planctomycetes bacterium]|nr:tRNA pseudouridine(13) synthase TruD [Planctomycetota bacterium]